MTEQARAFDRKAEDIKDAVIGRCIRVCAAAKDGRGRWRAEDDCALQLQAWGSSPAVAVAVALACARLGAFIAQKAAR